VTHTYRAGSFSQSLTHFFRLNDSLGNIMAFKQLKPRKVSISRKLAVSLFQFSAYAENLKSIRVHAHTNTQTNKLTLAHTACREYIFIHLYTHSKTARWHLAALQTHTPLSGAPSLLVGSIASVVLFFNPDLPDRRSHIMHTHI